MLLFIQMVLFLLVSSLHGVEPFLKETFIEEQAPQSRKTLPKARSEALDHLEVLGHDLTRLISEAASLLSEILDAGIEVTEGQKKGFMDVLTKDRTYTLQKLDHATRAVKDHQRTLQEIRGFIKPPQSKKGK